MLRTISVVRSMSKTGAGNFLEDFNLSQVRLAKDQHPVQALATYGANQTTPHMDFATAIQARSVGRGRPSP